MSVIENLRRVFDWARVPTSNVRINDVESKGERPFCPYRNFKEGQMPTCAISRRKLNQPCNHPLASIENCEVANFGDRPPDLCGNSEVYFLPGYNE